LPLRNAGASHNVDTEAAIVCPIPYALPESLEAADDAAIDRLDQVIHLESGTIGKPFRNDMCNCQAFSSLLNTQPEASEPSVVGRTLVAR